MSTTTPFTPSSGGNTDIIDDWLAELRLALAAGRRVRAGRILAEAEEHLHEAADELQATGLSPAEAAQRAVDRLGAAGAYAARFRQPTGFDWLVDAARTLVPAIGWALVALGAISTFVAALDWVIGAGAIGGHGVRVWRTCPESVDGQCVGPWHNVYASSTLIAGGALIILGLLLVLSAGLIRHRYSARELFPRWIFWTGNGLLTTLGGLLLIGGAVRSSLDHSWHWVPFWATTGAVCLVIAALAARHERRLPARP